MMVSNGSKNNDSGRGRRGPSCTIAIASVIVVIGFAILQLVGPAYKSFSYFRPSTLYEVTRTVSFSSMDDSLNEWLTEISGADETSCSSVFDNVRRGVWEDPNHDKFLYRRIKTEPHFLVSVHNQEYDPVRYEPIYNNGNYYEGEVIRRFEYILNENKNAFDYNSTKTLPLVIDIGGNIGFYTLLSAAWKHAVLTFEINPANLVRICESLHLNNNNEHGFSELSHSMAVRIHQQGVSNVTGKELRVVVPRNPGQTKLDGGPKGKDLGGTSERVFSTRTVTLDDFATQRGWFNRTDTIVSLLKIDTEGHELQIVMGAKRFIQSRRAKNILLEYRIHCRKAMDLLFDSGYVLVSSTRMANGVTSKLLSKEESIKFLDAETARLALRKSGDAYADLWFRLDSVEL